MGCSVAFSKPILGAELTVPLRDQSMEWVSDNKYGRIKKWPTLHVNTENNSTHVYTKMYIHVHVSNIHVHVLVHYDQTTYQATPSFSVLKQYMLALSSLVPRPS